MTNVSRFLVVLAVAATVAASADTTIKVVRVVDGDTIKAEMPSNQIVSVRLCGIDSPEKEQRFGRYAEQVLKNLISGETLRLQVAGRDRYGRLIANLYVGDTLINHALVAAGAAWVSTKYAAGCFSATDLAKIREGEADARSAKTGLWSDPQPVPPWAFRRAKRGH